jgi:hypothetical protein
LACRCGYRPACPVAAWAEAQHGRENAPSTSISSPIRFFSLHNNNCRSLKMGDQRSFSFPLLKANDVLQCMQELQIELTGEELAAATPEAVRRVFETVVDICMGVTKDELNQPAAAGLEVLEHGELHEDSIPQLAYFRAV